MTALAQQASVSVLRDSESGKTLLQIMTADGSFHFIELPEILPEAPPPTGLLHSLNGVLRRLLMNHSPIVWVDGDYSGVNFNKVLTRGPQFRVQDPLSTTASDTIAKLLSAPPLTAASSQLLVGVPADPAQTQSTFGSNANASLWAEEAQRWSKASGETAGSIATTPASRESVLKALSTSANVIIVVAHSDGTRVHFPHPPPEGSVLSGDDLLANREAITRNSPTVYLMCCKAARVAEVRSLADALLEAGARAVYAPLVPIGSPLKLFRNFVKFGRSESPAIAFAKAESKTGNREMVAWVQ